MPRRHKRSSWGSNEDAGGGRRRLRFWADLHDGKGYARHSVTIVGTRRDGDDALARIRVEHAEDRPCPTLQQAWEMWYLPELEARVEDGVMSSQTLNVYRSMWRSHVAPTFGDSPVTSIRPLEIQGWLSDMTADPARKSLTLLSCVLAKCVMYEVLDHNVAKEDYMMPRKVANARQKDVYTVAEMVEALDAARGAVAYLPAILCGVASCRIGESLGPKAADVRRYDRDGMTLAVVDIHRQVDRRGEVTERLKTSSSRRAVIVPEPWSLDVLSAADGADEWLCGDGCGEPCKPYTVTRTWERALRSAGVSPIPMRNLRNSWRTYMRWELGVPEDMLEAMMGHVGRNVGEIHYDRPRWEAFAQTVADAWVRYRAGENGRG